MVEKWGDGLKYCVKCGSEMEDDAIFCSKCGNKANTENPVKEKKSKNLVLVVSVISVMLLVIIVLLICIITMRSKRDDEVSTKITTEITETVTETSDTTVEILQTTELTTEVTTEVVTEEVTTAEEVVSNVPVGYTIYTNDKLGYTIAIPEGFEIIDESENGDGVTFGDTNGYAQIQVWGTYNVLGSTGKSEIELANSNYSLYDSNFDNNSCWYSYEDAGVYNFVANYFTEEIEVGFSFRYITDFYEERYDLLCTEMADYVITGKPVQ